MIYLNQLIIIEGRKNEGTKYNVGMPTNSHDMDKCNENYHDNKCK